MKITASIIGIDRVTKMLTESAKNIMPDVSSKAINSVAFDARRELITEMDKVFDRPTPYIQNSILVIKSTPDNLNATVMVKDAATKGTPPNRILTPHVYGGSRPVKRSEALLASAGRIKSGQYLLPFKAVKDKYGNVSPGTIQRVLSGLQAQNDPYQNTSPDGRGRGTRKGRTVKYRYAVVERNGKTLIMQFEKGRSTPLFIAEDHVSYVKRYDFHGIVRRTFEAKIYKAISKELERAR